MPINVIYELSAILVPERGTERQGSWGSGYFVGGVCVCHECTNLYDGSWVGVVRERMEEVAGGGICRWQLPSVSLICIKLSFLSNKMILILLYL